MSVIEFAESGKTDIKYEKTVFDSGVEFVKGLYHGILGPLDLLVNFFGFQNRYNFGYSDEYGSGITIRNDDGTYTPLIIKAKGELPNEGFYSSNRVQLRTALMVIFIILFGVILPLWILSSILTAIIIGMKYKRSKNFNMSKFQVVSSIIFGPIFIVEQIVRLIFWRYF